MLDQRIIGESNSPYCSPIVLVPKKEGNEKRFCVDFRKLNEVTQECQHLSIRELINNVGDNKIFTLDLVKGYWQILLTESSKEYTALRSPGNKCYQFRVQY